MRTVREIRVPKMGMNSTDVDVVALHVEPGDEVRVGSPLVDVESEKTAVTLEADSAGRVIGVFVKVGDSVPVGTVICRLEDV
jgi:pyruvate dehydrogenase E2 component (dihydrolipoamide acetyltransferase)